MAITDFRPTLGKFELSTSGSILTGNNAAFCAKFLEKRTGGAPAGLESLTYVLPGQGQEGGGQEERPSVVVNLLMQLRASCDQNNFFLRTGQAAQAQVMARLHQVLGQYSGAARVQAEEIERAIRTRLVQEEEFSRALGKLEREIKKNSVSLNRPGSEGGGWLWSGGLSRRERGRTPPEDFLRIQMHRSELLRSIGMRQERRAGPGTESHPDTVLKREERVFPEARRSREERSGARPTHLREESGAEAREPLRGREKEPARPAGKRRKRDGFSGKRPKPQTPEAERDTRTIPPPETERAARASEHAPPAQPQSAPQGFLPVLPQISREVWALGRTRAPVNGQIFSNAPPGRAAPAGEGGGVRFQARPAGGMRDGAPRSGGWPLISVTLPPLRTIPYREALTSDRETLTLHREVLHPSHEVLHPSREVVDPDRKVLYQDRETLAGMRSEARLLPRTGAEGQLLYRESVLPLPGGSEAPVRQLRERVSWRRGTNILWLPLAQASPEGYPLLGDSRKDTFQQTVLRRVWERLLSVQPQSVPQGFLSVLPQISREIWRKALWRTLVPVTPPPLRTVPTPDREALALHREALTSDRETLPLHREVLHPGRELVGPGRKVLYPDREALDQGREVLYPGREVLYPGREVLYPGREALDQGREALAGMQSEARLLPRTGAEGQLLYRESGFPLPGGSETYVRRVWEQISRRRGTDIHWPRLAQAAPERDSLLPDSRNSTFQRAVLRRVWERFPSAQLRSVPKGFFPVPPPVSREVWRQGWLSLLTGQRELWRSPVLPGAPPEVQLLPRTGAGGGLLYQENVFSLPGGSETYVRQVWEQLSRRRGPDIQWPRLAQAAPGEYPRRAQAAPEEYPLLPDSRNGAFQQTVLRRVWERLLSAQPQSVPKGFWSTLPQISREIWRQGWISPLAGQKELWRSPVFSSAPPEVRLLSQSTAAGQDISRIFRGGLWVPGLPGGRGGQAAAQKPGGSGLEVYRRGPGRSGGADWNTLERIFPTLRRRQTQVGFFRPLRMDSPVDDMPRGSWSLGTEPVLRRAADRAGGLARGPAERTVFGRKALPAARLSGGPERPYGTSEGERRGYAAVLTRSGGRTEIRRDPLRRMPGLVEPRTASEQWKTEEFVRETWTRNHILYRALRQKSGTEAKTPLYTERSEEPKRGGPGAQRPGSAPRLTHFAQPLEAAEGTAFPVYRASEGRPPAGVSEQTEGLPVILYRTPARPAAPPASPAAAGQLEGEEVFRAQTVSGGQVRRMEQAFSYQAPGSRKEERGRSAADSPSPPRVEEQINYNRLTEEILVRLERRLRAERRKFGL